MRIAEIITEAREGYLYHKTSLVNAETMLRDDRIEGRTKQLIGAKRGKRRLLKRDEWTRRPIYVFDMKGGETVAGVSLTRDYAFAESWKGTVILVLDHTRLAQRHKIMPLDHIRSSRYDYTSPGVDFEKDWMYQAEEFVPGDIAPLSRYLVSINLRLEELDRTTLMDREDHAIILQNPLLNRIVPRGYRDEYERLHHVKKYGYGPEFDDHEGYYSRIDPDETWKSDWKLGEGQ